MDLNESKQLISLNEDQQSAYENIKEFITTNHTHFLLLGCAGTGKTTVIVNIFNSINEEYNYRILFCAFTNKATSVIKNIPEKYKINYTMEIMTIHKMLALTPSYLTGNLEYIFEISKIDYLKTTDIIVFDECSTISAELYNYVIESIDYIKAKHGKSIKCIWLGDFWQLPPINEVVSVVFKIASKEEWFVSKLNKIMRSNNESIYKINRKCIDYIEKVKSSLVVKKSNEPLIDEIFDKYPYNMISKKFPIYFKKMDSFYEHYMENYKKNNDIIILTYTRANCVKINNDIQSLIDSHFKREKQELFADCKVFDQISPTFYEGDRCCFDRMLDLTEIKIKKEVEIREGNHVDIDEFSMEYYDNFVFNMLDLNPDNKIVTEMLKDTKTCEYAFYNLKLKYKVWVLYDEKTRDEFVDIYFKISSSEIKINYQINTYHVASNKVIDKLYNGEVFLVLNAQSIKIKTPINRHLTNSYFDGQLLTLKKIKDDLIYKVLYIPESYINRAKSRMKHKLSKIAYNLCMEEFYKYHPIVYYGYCMTIYKSQGSEWDNVFVNLNSIISCFAQSRKDYVESNKNCNELEDKVNRAKLLIKSTYTAISRAKENLYLFHYK